VIERAWTIARRATGFAARHVWSLSLAGLSSLSFLELASEVQEGELGAFDRAVASWLQSSRGEWDAVMLALTHLGAGSSLTILSSFIALALLLARKRKELFYFVACGAGAAVWCSALKLLFQRARPDATSLYLISTPSSFSFPSGHAMGAAGVLGSLVVLVFASRATPVWRALSVVVAAPLIAGVAMSRVYFGVHYPSDVIGGQLAAAAWLAALAGWFYPRLLPAESTTAPKQ
jgi:undecaprenyl-diphosphatase